MSKEMKKQETSKEMALPQDLMGAWGAEEATATDFTIPRLRVMQALSEEVGTGEKLQGEIIKSTDKSTLAKKGEPIRVIPFNMTKSWQIYDVSNPGQPKWVRQEPWTAANENLEWNFEEGGKKFRRDKVYSFFTLLDKEVAEKPTSLPVQINFSRTSFYAGKILANHFATSMAEKTPPCLMKFDVVSEYVNEGDKKYYVYDVKHTNEKTPMELVKICKGWYDTIRAGKAKVDAETVADAEF
jgi:hypothetical protein